MRFCVVLEGADLLVADLVAGAVEEVLVGVHRLLVGPAEAVDHQRAVAGVPDGRCEAQEVAVAGHRDAPRGQRAQVGARALGVGELGAARRCGRGLRRTGVAPAASRARGAVVVPVVVVLAHPPHAHPGGAAGLCGGEAEGRRVGLGDRDRHVVQPLAELDPASLAEDRDRPAGLHPLDRAEAVGVGEAVRRVGRARGGVGPDPHAPAVEAGVVGPAGGLLAGAQVLDLDPDEVAEPVEVLHRADRQRDVPGGGAPDRADLLGVRRPVGPQLDRRAAGDEAGVEVDPGPLAAPAQLGHDLLRGRERGRRQRVGSHGAEGRRRGGGRPGAGGGHGGQRREHQRGGGGEGRSASGTRTSGHRRLFSGQVRCVT